MRKVGDLIANTLTAKKPMSEVETIRRLVRAAAPILEDPLLADDLPQWLGIKAKAGSRSSSDGTSAAVRAGVG